MRYVSIFIFIFILATSATAQSPPPPSKLQHDDRLKVDLLLVVAHPDDETGFVSYMVQAMEKGKKVAAVYLTRGEAGHNNMGTERAASLGVVREMELRHALASVGVQNVWFLSGRDTPTQDVLQSLGNWGHGTALEQVVRMIRVTRPEVIVTWLPGFFMGENHGDHQAAGVVATEAFDLAGSAAAFPAQLAIARHVNETILEGLRPWQAKKIYYFSDAENQSQFQQYGPQYSVAAMSPSRKMPYWRIALNEFRFHLTQYRSYIEKLNALSDAELAKRAASDGWDQPLQLILGKSLVKSSVTGDLFEGVTPGAVPASTSAASTAEPQDGSSLSVELAGPWGFYRAFLPAHGLERLPQASVPEIAIAQGSTLQVPVLIRNRAGSPQEVSLSVTLPPGWTSESGPTTYTVPANDVYPLQISLTAPKAVDKQAQEIVCEFKSGGKSVGAIHMRVQLRSGGLPQ